MNRGTPFVNGANYFVAMRWISMGCSLWRRVILRAFIKKNYFEDERIFLGFQDFREMSEYMSENWEFIVGKFKENSRKILGKFY